MQIPFCFAFFVLFWSPVSSAFSDVTESVGISVVKGYVAAFGDFNGDKETDLFVVTDEGKRLEILFWDNSDLKFKKGKAEVLLSEQIVNVSPTDFDGDGCLDVLITTQLQNAGSQETATVFVYWGNLQTLGDNVSFTMRDQPLVMDANGDLLPDLLGESVGGNVRSYWISKGSNRSFDVQPQSNSSGKLNPIRVPHSNAFLDLTGDYTADLYVSNQQNKGEIWVNEAGILTFRQTISPPPITSKEIKIFGQSTFADIDGDGRLDMLLPVCTKDDCSESSVYVYSSGRWWKMMSNERRPNTWQFIPPANQTSSMFPLMTIRTGDYDMDGFYDGLVVMDINVPGGQSYRKVAVLLENVACSSTEHDYCLKDKRAFEVHWKDLSNLEDAVLATFYDLYEDGQIDILMVTESSSTAQYQIHALENAFYYDASFLKVYILGGRTLTTCANDNLPYGVNQVGPFIKYTTTSTNGDIKYGSAAQLSQSAYFALQCPYTVFGLGRTPNFVDDLAVGMPGSIKRPKRNQTWESIIPNSQVIVIPYPPDDPSSWTMKLLVTPSKLVLLTGLSLLGICVVIGIIILLLHLKEKREDQKEKQRDAHKFHFDAM
ncbi:unnamed protein product [Porites lobata]|uniref:T-cell immunomodulatory protein TIP C2 domain-containing protein n=1 Tax=Porites lobata TaxID=104759 RepID=A0ABN8PZS6_9CNID|nr:unnamed protein product [Porites lobata]